VLVIAVVVVGLIVVAVVVASGGVVNQSASINLHQSIYQSINQSVFFNVAKFRQIADRGVATGGYRDISPQISPSELFMG